MNKQITRIFYYKDGQVPHPFTCFKIEIEGTKFIRKSWLKWDNLKGYFFQI